MHRLRLFAAVIVLAAAAPAHAQTVIWTPPGVDHWHGATIRNGMSHIAVTGTVDGRNVEWKDRVSDEEYDR